MNIIMRFPNGKTKALTLSYDDGVIQDKRLLRILDLNGIKATFNINSGLFSAEDVADHGRMSEKQVKELYTGSGHEVACHSLTHPNLENLPVAIALDEVLQDRKNLESLFGGIISGFAYPYGRYSDALIEALKMIGIAYARAAIFTQDFRIPTDWFRLTSTCHHKDPALMELADKFLKADPDSERHGRQPLLFYLFGHAYEFDDDDNWNVIEDFAQKVGRREDIWYATNIEIYDYIEAYRSLKFSADCNYVYNPSGQMVWFDKNCFLYSVGPNETKNLA